MRAVNKTYWTFILNDETFDADFKTQQEAEDFAEAMLAEQCEEDCIKGYVMKELELIELYYDDNCELVITQRKKSFIEYTFYQGHVKEHGTMHNLV